MKLVVGLGNPGRQYESTRHNVGFRVIDELARRWQLNVGRRQFQGTAELGRIRDQRVLLLKPGTYMNRSGGSVREAATFHKVEPADLLIVLDDMALPLGRIRIRGGGSAGGHHGLADVIRELGTDAVARLRIGIEQVSGERMVDHVLSPFNTEEEAVVGPAVGRAADAVECFLAEGLEAAMNRFNRTEEPSGE
ncbi:MAG TPA: aminoacyl-tRNA hydrolase [Phycisphaerae bacterium]|nr:aminoacyl-tRNA hydrolase [Phycisphaerae bacterium]HRY66996.1 aminoacyl-tRNA hydrolase [Phycisphaerae bacterium]HSA28835.1 aminoacyl-tRNA hydrolase [Phycisphaerae bacterium]